MLTYTARPRGLYKETDNAELIFPCQVNLTFSFEPCSTFGGEGSPVRTVVKGANTIISVNFCKGETHISTNDRLEPVNVELKGILGSINFTGSSMSTSFEAESQSHLEAILQAYYYCMPALLSIEMIDTPTISEVRGIAGQVPFCWGVLDTGWCGYDAVTKKQQEERIIAAFDNLKLLRVGISIPNWRLLAATQYFYLACRLNRSGVKLWEFLAEALLNEAKILEILFPAPQGKTIDYARKGLRSLGFSEVEIEALYIPAIALRNAIDVGHPMIAKLSSREAAILYRYADRSEEAFRSLLKRVFKKVEEGTFSPENVNNVAPTTDMKKTINRIEENLELYDKQN